MNGNYVARKKGRQLFPSVCFEQCYQETAQSLPCALEEQKGSLPWLSQALHWGGSEVTGSGEFGLPWDMPKKA